MPKSRRDELRSKWQSLVFQSEMYGGNYGHGLACQAEAARIVLECYHTPSDDGSDEERVRSYSPAPEPAPAPLDIGAVMDEGLRLLRANCFEAAIEQFNAVIFELHTGPRINDFSDRHTAAIALDYAGDARVALGDLEKAESNYRRACALYPTYDPPSKSLRQLELRKEAISKFDSGISYSKGEYLLSSAMREFNEALKLLSDGTGEDGFFDKGLASKVLFFCGNTRERMGDAEKAKSAYRRAVLADSTNADARNALNRLEGSTVFASAAASSAVHGFASAHAAYR